MELDPRVLKILVRLGVPGVALGVFALLLGKFVFHFDTISGTWAAVIAILFLVVVTVVTIVALVLPKRTEADVTGESASVGASGIGVGKHVVVCKSAPKKKVLRFGDGIVEWRPAMRAFCGRRATVTSVSDRGPAAVRLDVDDGENWWSLEWLKSSS